MVSQSSHARPKKSWRWAQRVTVLSALCIAALVLTACPARLLGLQGRLLGANGAPLTGVFDMTFDYWTCATGTSGINCTKVFTQVHNDVPVTNGLFDVAIGSSDLNTTSAPDPAIFANQLWVEITIAQADGSSPETLTPRQRLTGAPYAMSLAGGAVVIGIQDGEPGDPGNIANDYASLTVASFIDGTALGIRGLQNNGGDLIRACVGPSLSAATARECPELRMRLTAAGQMRLDSNVVTGGADFAEFMHVDAARAIAAYEPGDVLVISPDQDRAVTLSTEPNSTAVIGVYSTDPGLLGGGRYLPEGELSSPDLIPVGIVGIVPVKVSAENGPIHRGDLLTTSATPGHAMLADAYVPGAILGKAMGELASGTGVIEVVLLLQ